MKIIEEFKIKTARFRKIKEDGKEYLQVSKDGLNWHPCFEKIYGEAVRVFISQEKEKKAKVGN
jgi:hypothetical protein